MTQTDTEQKASDALSRFEARMAEEEEVSRPKRTPGQTMSLAIQKLVELKALHQERVNQGNFAMKSAEKAAKEELEELDWLIRDLQDLGLTGFVPDSQ